MSELQVTALGADELPLPMGVLASTGQLLPGLTTQDLRHIDDSDGAVQARGSSDNTGFLAVSDVDPNKLEEAGWGIVFTHDADPAIRQALDR